MQGRTQQNMRMRDAPARCTRPTVPNRESSSGGTRCAASFKRLTRCQYLKNVIFLHIKLKRIIVNQPLVVSEWPRPGQPSPIHWIPDQARLAQRSTAKRSAQQWPPCQWSGQMRLLYGGFTSQTDDVVAKKYSMAKQRLKRTLHACAHTHSTQHSNNNKPNDAAAA